MELGCYKPVNSFNTFLNLLIVSMSFHHQTNRGLNDGIFFLLLHTSQCLLGNSYHLQPSKSKPVHWMREEMLHVCRNSGLGNTLCPELLSRFSQAFLPLWVQSFPLP